MITSACSYISVIESSPRWVLEWQLRRLRFWC